jgi:hypothetical protein
MGIYSSMSLAQSIADLTRFGLDGMTEEGLQMMRLIVPNHPKDRPLLHRHTGMTGDKWVATCGRHLAHKHWGIWPIEIRPTEAAQAMGATVCKRCWNTRRMR